MSSQSISFTVQAPTGGIGTGPVEAGYLGIDIGATKWIVASTADPGRTWQGLITDDPDRCFEDLRRAVSCTASDFRAAGVSFAGSVDAQGVIDGWPSRPSWAGRRPVFEIFGAMAVPVTTEDDGLCAALGEGDRAAAGLHDFLALTFGTGVGGAVVIGGRPRRSRRRSGRTLGHIRLPGLDDPCRCGSLGCLQAVLLGEGSEQRSADGLLAGVRRSRVGSMVVDWASVLGLDGVVLTGGLLGHIPEFAESLTEEIMREAEGTGLDVRVSDTPHESALWGAQRLARWPELVEG